MRHFQLLVFTFALAAATGATAFAAQSNLTLKAGAELQENTSTYHSNNFAAGAEYEFIHATPVSPLSISFYADVLGDSSGFGLSARSATPVYLGAGVGLYQASITPVYAGPASIPPMGSPAQPVPPFTANGTGGKVFVGLQMGKVAALEAGYHFMPPASGHTTNALSLELGFRL